MFRIIQLWDIFLFEYVLSLEWLPAQNLIQEISEAQCNKEP